MLRVPGSTSTRMGHAPTCSITLTHEQNVMGVVRTASPGPIPRLTSARCRAAVQELNARAAGASTAAANSSSKRFTLGPVVIQSERSVSTTSAISSSLIQDGEGIFLFTLPATFWNLFWTNDRVAQDCNYRVIAVIASCIREWRFAVVGL